jgi:hypothetical protein
LSKFDPIRCVVCAVRAALAFLDLSRADASRARVTTQGNPYAWSDFEQYLAPLSPQVSEINYVDHPNTEPPAFDAGVRTQPPPDPPFSLAQRSMMVPDATVTHGDPTQPPEELSERPPVTLQVGADPEMPSPPLEPQVDRGRSAVHPQGRPDQDPRTPAGLTIQNLPGSLQLAANWAMEIQSRLQSTISEKERADAQLLQQKEELQQLRQIKQEDRARKTKLAQLPRCCVAGSSFGAQSECNCLLCDDCLQQWKGENPNRLAIEYTYSGLHPCPWCKSHKLRFWPTTERYVLTPLSALSRPEHYQ